MMEGMFKGVAVAAIIVGIAIGMVWLLGAIAFGQNMSQMGHTPKTPVSASEAARTQRSQNAPWVAPRQEPKS